MGNDDSFPSTHNDIIVWDADFDISMGLKFPPINSGSLLFEVLSVVLLFLIIVIDILMLMIFTLGCWWIHYKILIVIRSCEPLLPLVFFVQLLCVFVRKVKLKVIYFITLNIPKVLFTMSLLVWNCFYVFDYFVHIKLKLLQTFLLETNLILLFQKLWYPSLPSHLTFSYPLCLILFVFKNSI